MKILVACICLLILTGCATRTRDYSFNATKYYDATDATPVTVDTTSGAVGDADSTPAWQVVQTTTVVYKVPLKRPTGCALLTKCCIHK